MTPRQSLGARRRQHGGAALVMVLVLCLITTMAGAYAARNLVFEQRGAAHIARSAQAFELAEAGIDWAIGVLGQGRVDTDCLPSARPEHISVRERLLIQDADGRFTVPPPAAPPVAAERSLACMRDGDALRCQCPIGGAAPLDVLTGHSPGFIVRFVADGAAGRPGVARLEAVGCTRLGAACLTSGPMASGEARSRVTALLALSPALAAPPTSALTVRGTLDLGGNAVRVVNADADGSGLTVVAAGPVVGSGAASLTSRPGSPGTASLVEHDAGMAALDADRYFTATFGVDRASYRDQPAAVRVACTGDCAGALQQAAARHPGQVLLLQGDATLAAPVTLGTPQAPVLLVVEGRLTTAADFDLQGLLYLRGDRWTAEGAAARVRGAVVAETALTLAGTPTLIRDADTLRRLQRLQGSLVRVPGGWRDVAAAR